MINADQARMARALVKLGVRDVAAKANVQPNTVSRAENGKEARKSTMDALQSVYEELGCLFIPENGGGAGVRLRDRSTPADAGDAVE